MPSEKPRTDAIQAFSSPQRPPPRSHMLTLSALVVMLAPPDVAWPSDQPSRPPACAHPRRPAACLPGDASRV